MNVYEIKTIKDLILNNPYVGRGIIVGKTPDGKNAVSAYFIMGRSTNSRNRIFAETDGSLYTRPFDEALVEDPSLIIYRAVCTCGGKLIVSNGDQTDTVYDGLKAGKTFAQSLEIREFEPDAPNFTPRITALLNLDSDKFSYDMSILKSIDETGSDCCRYTYSYPAKNGLGHFIHTYITDGNPIPTFCGEPERMEMSDEIDAFTNELWNALDENNRISLYVRYTNICDGTCTNRLINKNK